MSEIAGRVSSVTITTATIESSHVEDRCGSGSLYSDCYVDGIVKNLKQSKIDQTCIR